MDAPKNFAQRKRQLSLTWSIKLFFIANEIVNEKKVAIFLSVIGSKMYTILQSGKTI